MIMIRYLTDVFPDLYNYEPVLSPKKKKCKKAKWLSEEALQISEKRREAQGKGEKEKYTHLNAEFQIIARRDKKGNEVVLFQLVKTNRVRLYFGGLQNHCRW